MYGKALAQDPCMPYYLLNAFLLMLVSVAITSLIGALAAKEEVLPAIVNVLSLGMSFLCGVFAPMEMLDANVAKIAQYLPFTWFEKVNALLADAAAVTPALRAGVWRGIGVQALFAAAFFAASFAVGRVKERE